MDRSVFVSRRVLLQDLGMLLFIASVVGAALITALAGRALIYQNVVMMLAILLAALLVTMRAHVAGTVVSAFTLLVFAIYKLYNHIAYSAEIEWTAYLWPALILASLGGMVMFISMFSSLEGTNGILIRRLDELTVMDPVTQMENMRSMISSLQRYMALCERNGTQMGLMMIRLRYCDEIRKVLTSAQFNDLRHNLAVTVSNALRLEDRVFSIDENGSLGIIYFSAESGASVVKSRVLDAVANRDMLGSVEGQMLTVDLSVVYKQYDKQYGKDALKLISDLEKEFAYAV